MNTKINEFEVMAPVGSRESLAAAIQAGADSVYFGIGKLNMRSHSANHFTIDDLREIAATCNEHGIKTYLTVNTVINLFIWQAPSATCCSSESDYTHFSINTKVMKPRRRA